MSALRDDERAVLVAGVSQWGGPAHPTNELALFLGTTGVPDLVTRSERVRETLASGGDLTDSDLIFAIASTEICFASDRYGAGWDWETATGFDDSTTISVLRELQRRTVGLR